MDELQTLRVGIVGLGIGRHHLKAFQQLPGVAVIALADVDDERLHSLGAEYAVPHLYHDYRELVARDDLDIVSVCTPNYLHAPVAIAALEHGKHVFCEKPLAHSLEAGEAMAAAAQQARRALLVTFNHRQRGDVQTLKRYIVEGGLGRIYHSKAWWVRRSGIPGLGSWFTRKDMAGGGPLIDLGVHMLDMALYLLGEPRPLTVSAATYAEFGPRGLGGWGGGRRVVSETYEVEDLASAFIRLEGDATLLLETSWATYREDGDEFGVTLYGSEGGAEIRVKNYVNDDTLDLYVDVAGAPAVIHPRVNKGEGHLAVAREFVALIRSGDWAACMGQEGLTRARILDACYRSAAARREVALG